MLRMRAHTLGKSTYVESVHALNRSLASRTYRADTSLGTKCSIECSTWPHASFEFARALTDHVHPHVRVTVYTIL